MVPLLRFLVMVPVVVCWNVDGYFNRDFDWVVNDFLFVNGNFFDNLVRHRFVHVYRYGPVNRNSDGIRDFLNNPIGNFFLDFHWDGVRFLDGDFNFIGHLLFDCVGYLLLYVDGIWFGNFHRVRLVNWNLKHPKKSVDPILIVVTSTNIFTPKAQRKLY